MSRVGKLDRKWYFLLILALIGLIGFLDYESGAEMSFALFYLLPISVIARSKGTTLPTISFCAVLSAVLWFLAEFHGRVYSSVAFPIWNSFVRLSIFMAVGALIYYLKESDKKLGELNSYLQQINNEKNKFIGIAAHDLRSPIAGIHALSDILLLEKQDSGDSDLLEIINMIRRMSGNMLNMLKNLLDVSKIESGKIELNLKHQDYIEFIRRQIILSQLIANKKGISIIFNHEVDNLVISFDEHYLIEVIDNFLSNAIKYSDNGKQVLINVRLTDSKKVLTECIDSGNGIPEKEQNSLFNYFQTTSVRPTEGEQSTGLGLAIAKRIVILHDGEIGLKSELGKGSNFFYALPL